MRPIDADKLKLGLLATQKNVSDKAEAMPTRFKAGVCVGLAAAIQRVINAPTIEAEPVRHGRWLVKDNIYPVCSECSELSDYNCDGTHKQSPYCPNCGAKMDGGNENESNES